jgi:hypothetical protein
MEKLSYLKMNFNSFCQLHEYAPFLSQVRVRILQLDILPQGVSLDGDTPFGFLIMVCTFVKAGHSPFVLTRLLIFLLSTPPPPPPFPLKYVYHVLLVVTKITSLHL